MMSGIPSVEQAERMVANHLTNVSEFCVDPGAEFETKTSVQGACPYAVPSISRSDPNFWDNTYWRGENTSNLYHNLICLDVFDRLLVLQAGSGAR